MLEILHTLNRESSFCVLLGVLGVGGDGGAERDLPRLAYRGWDWARLAYRGWDVGEGEGVEYGGGFLPGGVT